MTTPRTRLDELRKAVARAKGVVGTKWDDGRVLPSIYVSDFEDLLALVEAAVAWRDSMQLKGGSLSPLSDALENEAAKWTDPTE